MSADRMAGSLTAVACITVMTLGTLAAQADLPATWMVSVDGRMTQVRGHQVPRNDSALVAQLVTHVLKCSFQVSRT